ncbi:acyl-CoA thioesterase [Candidatus Omnitrophota bacterium]
MKSHKTELRVRYEETDRMGVVYYAKYLIWFEVARTELFHKLGLPYTQLEAQGVRLMVASAACNYKAPATYDDLVTVETEISEVKNTSLAFTYKVSRGETLLATGSTTHVFTDTRGKPMRIPGKVKEVLTVSS